ncbi:MAG: peptidylprolyl isomerase [Spirochaetaceae bacterium]
MNFSKRTVILLLTLLFISTISCTSNEEKKSNIDIKNLDDGLYANIITNKGDILLSLEYEKTPLTVTNFVALAEGTMTDATRKGKYFDGLDFHRVIANFMIQGGCPDGTGRGNPGYKFPDEFDPTLTHDRAGTLSMANSGPGTNGSQFFITHGPTPHLDGKHTVFGYVVEGQDVVNKIANKDKIISVKIMRIGDNANNFNPTQDTFEQLKVDIELEEVLASEKENIEIIGKIKSDYPDIKLSEEGIYYTILKDGNGEKPTANQMVSVHYTGEFLNGEVFDSSVTRGEPIEFAVGTGRVIPGWDISLLNMTLGEKRVVYIPYQLAYGVNGRGPIPPKSWLKFEMELLNIK